MEFRTDVFDAATIETLIERLQRVLVAITADPAARLSSIDVLDDRRACPAGRVGQPGGVGRTRAGTGVDSGDCSPRR